MERSLPLLHGTLDVLILNALSRKEVHGRGIARWIRDTTGGVLEVEEGALYPALRRLERRGLVTSRWSVTEAGRKARLYALTAAGSKARLGEMGAWARHAVAMPPSTDSARPDGKP